MARPERTARLLLGLALLVLGLSVLIFPIRSSGPLPTSIIIVEGLASAILIALGLIALLLARIGRKLDGEKQNDGSADATGSED